MNILEITYFMVVAEEKSFSRAAERLFVSQPAVSAQVTKLEEEWGFRLFNRKYREALLTPAGQNMYDLFSQMKNDFNHALARSRQMPDTPIVTLYVGVTEYLNCDSLIKAVRDFENEHSNVKVRIEVGPMSRNTFGHDYANPYDVVISQELYLAGSRCDLGVLPYSSGKSSFYLPRSIFESKGRKQPDISDLEGKTVYMSAGLVSGTATEFCKNICESIGVRCGDVVELPTISSCLLSLNIDEGVVLLDSCSILGNREEQYAILEMPLDIHWVVAWRKNIERPFVKELAECISRVALENHK